MTLRTLPGALLTVVATLGVIAVSAHLSPAAGDTGPVAFRGRPGDRLPLDVILRDDTGATRRLGDLADRPLLLTFVPSVCGRQCPLVLGGLAEALGGLRLRPGEEYAVVNVSIDENDTPERAAAAKHNYLEAVGAPYPAAAWKFLTGDRAAINRLTEALGLRFQRHGDHFFHPEVLLAIAPGGVISSVLPVEAMRYNGRLRVTFPSAALEQALSGARRGAVSPGRPPEPLYCLPYERDPERAFYRLLRAFGVMNLLALGAVLVWLRAGRRGAAQGGRS